MANNTKKNGAESIIDELMTLLRTLDDATIAASRSVYDSEMKPRIARLRRLAKDQPGEIYTREKILDFEWSLEALAGINDGNLHSRYQHTIWAVGALNVLSGLDFRKDDVPKQLQ